jgi:hydrogenase large subunit
VIGPTFPGAAAAALDFIEALADVRAGKTKTWRRSPCPTGASDAASPGGAVCLAHHMVIKGGKIAQHHPSPADPWSADPRDVYGTPGPYEDAVIDSPIFEENSVENQGIDIMRSVRSRPVLAVRRAHVPRKKVLKKLHSPTQVAPQTRF